MKRDIEPSRGTKTSITIYNYRVDCLFNIYYSVSLIDSVERKRDNQEKEKLIMQDQKNSNGV